MTQAKERYYIDMKRVRFNVRVYAVYASSGYICLAV
jgi:hypothetical protein